MVNFAKNKDREGKEVTFVLSVTLRIIANIQTSHPNLHRLISHNIKHSLLSSFSPPSFDSWTVREDFFHHLHNNSYPEVLVHTAYPLSEISWVFFSTLSKHSSDWLPLINKSASGTAV